MGSKSRNPQSRASVSEAKENSVLGASFAKHK